MQPSLLCALLACALLAGCSPEPPEKERPPEPQAAQAPATTDTTAAASQDPIERARAVQDTLDEADQRQREAIDDSGG
jgi:hypothetical protein